MLAADQVAVIIHAVADGEEGAPGTGLHQADEDLGGILRAGTVVKGESAGFVIREVVGLLRGFRSQHIPDFRIEDSDLHQGVLIRIQQVRRVMQHEGHAVKGELRLFQGGTLAEGIQLLRIGLYIRPVGGEGFPDAAGQEGPGGSVIEQVAEHNPLAGNHIVGAGGDPLGGEVLVERGPCLHQEAHPAEAGAAVADFHIQPAVFLAGVFGIRKEVAELFHPAGSDAVDLLRDRRKGGFHLPEADLRLVAAGGIGIGAGDLVAVLQGFCMGCAERQSAQQKQNGQQQRDNPLYKTGPKN